MTVNDWLVRLDLPKLDLAMHRILPAQGYAKEVTIGQTVQWLDFDILISGVLSDMHMPVEGWSGFWNRFSTRSDIRPEARIEHVEPRDNSVILMSGDGRERFDGLISTIPTDEFAKLTQLLPAEKAVLQGVEWQNYTTTLVASKNWFKGAQVHGFSRACRDPSLRGAMLGARREGAVMEDGAHLYVTGQFSNGLTPPELREILMADLEVFPPVPGGRRGGRIVHRDARGAGRQADVVQRGDVLARAGLIWGRAVPPVRAGPGETGELTFPYIGSDR